MSLNSISDWSFAVEKIKNIEERAISAHALSITKLMERASAAVMTGLEKKFGMPSELTIFCGIGNNAADGYLVAALAAEKSVRVRVIEVGDLRRQNAEVSDARSIAVKAGVELLSPKTDREITDGIIIDALIGTGLRSKMGSDYIEAIKLINASKVPVVAIDVPSGLNADSGDVTDLAVEADLTVTFVGFKRGMMTGQASSFCGEVVLDSLEIPIAAYNIESSDSEILRLGSLLGHLPTRVKTAHKYHFGHAMVVGGELGFGGAAILAAQSCIQTGAGLVSLCTRSEHIGSMLARQPEVMTRAIDSGQELEPLLNAASVLIIGPGLGKSAWSEQLLQKSVQAGHPMVVDADALNLIAEDRLPINFSELSWVITPHSGEAARLLGTSARVVEEDRFSAVRALQKKYTATVILKGPGTLIVGDAVTGPRICPYGSPAMATAGMGDLLTGIVGSLIAQGMPLQVAAELGCCIHSKAADLAVHRYGKLGLTATDILSFIGSILNSDPTIVDESIEISRGIRI